MFWSVFFPATSFGGRRLALRGVSGWLNLFTPAAFGVQESARAEIRILERIQLSAGREALPLEEVRLGCLRDSGYLISEIHWADDFSRAFCPDARISSSSRSKFSPRYSA